MSADDAVDRDRLGGLPRPRLDEARIVAAPVAS
jgi:hypothetical protein